MTICSQLDWGLRWATRAKSDGRYIEDRSQDASMDVGMATRNPSR